MKKYIKNLTTLDRVLQFDLDQLRLQVSALYSEIDRISQSRSDLLENCKQQRAHIINTPEACITFNAYEQWVGKSQAQMGESLEKLEEKLAELQEFLMEKFQDSKKINHKLQSVKAEAATLEKQNEQKVLDQLGELRFHLRKLKSEKD